MMRMGLLTLIAMLAFAGNSLLCRLALASGAIDALSFTSLRLGSGALLLVLIMAPHWRRHGRRPARLSMALMLFGYMLCFSLAYRSLSAATGALLLFGTVQLTMFAVALAGGERYAPRRWLGLLLALAGLAIIGVGAYIQIGAKHYLDFLDSTYLNTPIVFIIVGKERSESI